MIKHSGKTTISFGQISSWWKFEKCGITVLNKIFNTTVQWFTGKGVYLGLFAMWQRVANFLTTAFSNSQPCNSAPKKGSHKEKSEHSQLKCLLLAPIVLKPMTSLPDFFTWIDSSQRQNMRFLERYFSHANKTATLIHFPTMKLVFKIL